MVSRLVTSERVANYPQLMSKLNDQQSNKYYYSTRQNVINIINK